MEMRDEFVVSVLFIPLTATRSSPTLREQCHAVCFLYGWELWKWFGFCALMHKNSPVSEIPYIFNEDSAYRWHR